MFRKIAFAAAAAAGLTLGLAAAGPAGAAEHEVKMLNRGAAGMMVFEPAYLEVAPGDSVTFVPTDVGHNAESAKGMTPAGAEPFKGAMSKEVTVTFDVEGVYGYQCRPHLPMGMVGVVVVGDPSANLADAKAVKLPGKGGKTMAGLLEQVEAKVAAN